MNFRRFTNLLREAHRTGKATPLFYPVVVPFTTLLLLPFFVLEPEVFEYPDHV